MRGTDGRVAAAAVLVLTVVVLAGCAAGPNNVSTVDIAQVAGFWPGVWHGMIYPIMFIISLFNKNVNIYEVHNNGGAQVQLRLRSGDRHPAHDLRGTRSGRPRPQASPLN